MCASAFVFSRFNSSMHIKIAHPKIFCGRLTLSHSLITQPVYVSEGLATTYFKQTNHSAVENVMKCKQNVVTGNNDQRSKRLNACYSNNIMCHTFDCIYIYCELVICDAMQRPRTTNIELKTITLHLLSWFNYIRLNLWLSMEIEPTKCARHKWQCNLTRARVLMQIPFSITATIFEVCHNTFFQ